MQTAAQIPYVPQPGPAQAPAAPPVAEIRFASDAALERALALAATQSWIASCAVDRTRRTLRVVLSAGVERPAFPAGPVDRVLH